MIDKRELRIGNVYFIKDEMGRLHEYVWSLNDFKALGVTLSEEELIPVPITEERLIEAGFKKTRFGNYSISQVSITCKNGEWMLQEGQFRGAYKLRFYYFHSLQNIVLDLAGREI